MQDNKVSKLGKFLGLLCKMWSSSICSYNGPHVLGLGFHLFCLFFLMRFLWAVMFDGPLENINGYVDFIGLRSDVGFGFLYPFMWLWNLTYFLYRYLSNIWGVTWLFPIA